MKQISIALIIVLTVLFAVSRFNADDTQFFSYYVTPDVWIILDTSGSMTWDMDGCRTWGDGSGDAADHYLGRDTDGDGLPNDSRLFLVKQALYSLVSDPEIDVRWGLATFYQSSYSGSSDGQYRYSTSYPIWSDCYGSPSSYSYPTMWWHGATRTFAYEAFLKRVEMAEGAPSHINEILSWVDNGLASTKGELHAQGGTPIAGALRGVRYEYQSKIPSDNAKWCRGYYVILLTDGEPTYGIEEATYNQGEAARWDGNGSTIEQLWKSQCYWEAESLMNTYIPPFAIDPDTVLPIKTYVVGVGHESQTLDSIAIFGGTEHYYPATNPDELQQVLRAIISDIINQATSYSGSEVTSIQEEFITTQYEARLYLCSFVPSWNPIWEGHMKAVKLIAGQWNIDSIPDSLVYWDAGDSLDARMANSRTIFTSQNYSLVSFDSSISPALLGVVTPEERDTIVRVVYTGTKKGITGYMGDIFHSTPLRIRGPNYFYEDDDFYLYREFQNSNRVPVLYAGGNDGMVHCIDDSTGRERWAYIPEDLLPRLKNLMGEHDYYVDANVMAADIWYPDPTEVPYDSFKNADEWKTVMFCGERQGGQAYSVLDVTYPSGAPGFLFKFDTTMAYLGETWSHPVMFKIHKNTLHEKDDRFFAFLGGGYWNDSLYDKFDWNTPEPPGTGFYMLDIVNMDGNPLPLLGTDYWQIPPMPTYADSMHWPFPSQPTAIDTNFDTYFDILFIGDWAGQLWKVTINGDSSDVIIDDWEAEIIFKAPRPDAANEDHLWQPIFFPATTAWDGRRWWVFFGTGDRANAAKEGTINRYYAIIDSTYDEPLDETDLKQVSNLGPLTEAEIQGNDYNGWYFIFTDFNYTDSIGKREGEKVTSFSTVLMDTLIFTTFQPYDLNNPCVNANGIARVYKIHYKKGSYNGTAPSRIVGTGLPQAPRYSFNISGSGMEIINLPGEVIVQPAPNLGIRRRLLWWFETR